jgi:hypothetical protein
VRRIAVKKEALAEQREVPMQKEEDDKDHLG